MKKFLPLLLAFAATPAFAHTGAIGHTHSALSGLLHPLTGADHMAALLAAGLVASAFSGWKRLVVPAAFLAALAAGFLLALSGFALPAVETAILASVIGLGALCVFNPGLMAATMIGSAFAVFHGFAHGAEIGGASGLGFGAGFLASSALVLTAGLLAGTLLRRGNPRIMTAIGAALTLFGVGLFAA